MNRSRSDSVNSVLKDRPRLGGSRRQPAHEDPTGAHSPNPEPSRLHELAGRFAGDDYHVVSKAAASIANSRIFAILYRFDPDAFSQRLVEKPELWCQLVNCLANLTKASLDQEKFKLRQKQAETRQRERAQKIRARKPILINADTIASIDSLIWQDARRAGPPNRNVAASRERADAPPSSGNPGVNHSGPPTKPHLNPEPSAQPSVLDHSASIIPELARIFAAVLAAPIHRSPSESTREDETPRWQDQHHDAEEHLVLSPS